MFAPGDTDPGCGSGQGNQVVIATHLQSWWWSQGGVGKMRVSTRIICPGGGACVWGRGTVLDMLSLVGFFPFKFIAGVAKLNILFKWLYLPYKISFKNGQIPQNTLELQITWKDAKSTDIHILYMVFENGVRLPSLFLSLFLLLLLPAKLIVIASLKNSILCQFF